MQANERDRLTGLLFSGVSADVRAAVSAEVVVAAKGNINTIKQIKTLSRSAIDSIVLSKALIQVNTHSLLKRSC